MKLLVAAAIALKEIGGLLFVFGSSLGAYNLACFSWNHQNHIYVGILPQEVWDHQLFRHIPSKHALYFIACYFSRMGCQGKLQDDLHGFEINKSQDSNSYRATKNSSAQQFKLQNRRLSSSFVFPDAGNVYPFGLCLAPMLQLLSRILHIRLMSLYGLIKCLISRTACTIFVKGIAN